MLDVDVTENPHAISTLTYVTEAAGPETLSEKSKDFQSEPLGTQAILRFNHTISDLLSLELQKLNVHPMSHHRNLNASIEYSLLKEERVVCTVYDSGGIPVKTLLDEVQNAGSYIFEFESNELPSGTYTCEFSTADGTAISKNVEVIH